MKPAQNFDMTLTFMTCFCSTDSSSDSEDGSSQHYSIEEQKERYRRRQLLERQPQQSKMCLSLTIAQGRVTGYIPAKVSARSHSTKVMDRVFCDQLVKIIEIILIIIIINIIYSR